MKALLFVSILLFDIIATGATVVTGDGLRLEFSDSGKTITSVSLDGQQLPKKENSGGLFLRDVSGAGIKSAFQHLSTGGAEQSLGIKAKLQFHKHRDHIAVDGTLLNLSPEKERCFDLKFYLPVDCHEWNWGRDLTQEIQIKKQIVGALTSDHITIYPIAPVSSEKLNAGLSLAVPPTSPTLFETGVDERGLFILFKIGISDATTPPNETKFSFIIYRHDPGWGFRSSLQRYYEIFHDPFFVRHVKKFGAWGWHHPAAPSQLTNANLYAFHEAGGELWQIKDEGMHGYEHEGTILPSTRDAWQQDAALPPGRAPHAIADLDQLGHFADDQKLGIYSLPYTIVGQRQVYHLPKMPTNRVDALAAFESWTTADPILIQNPSPSVSFRSAAQLKEIIRNSGIYDGQQKPTILMRQYLGNTLSFPQNPNPRLFFDTNKLTIAKYTLNDYLPMLFTSKYVDGCYVDSLGRWPGYYNFRREHFKYSTVPLTYTTQAGSSATEIDEAAEGRFVKPGKEQKQMRPQPCLWNLQSHAEYLWELSKRLHAQNKIVFANGVHPNRVMLGFDVDALGMEGLPDYTKHDTFYSARVAAYNKPYCALNGRDSVNSRVWNSCLYLGILIGSRSTEGEQLERKFLPTIIKINEAGWEPVTDARVNNEKVGIERWGKGGSGPTYFTLMNRSRQPAHAIVRVEADKLKLAKEIQLTELMSEKPITSKREGSNLLFEVELSAEQAIAILVKSPRG